MSTSPTNKDSQPIAVLLVDDQALVAEAIRRLLMGEADFALHYCSNPEQALEMAEQIKPMVILQDLVMPGVDGLDLVRRFREASSTKETPIIVLSTKEESATKQEAFSRGANDYLIKLPDKLELIARLRYHAKAYLNLCELNQAYEALHTSELRLRQIITHNADGVLVVGAQRLIRFANPAAEKIFRKKADELVGTSFDHALIPDEPFEFSLPGSGGFSTTVDARSVDTEWEGQPACLVSLRDVTERKQAEEERKKMELQLQQAQKLESIGQLAAGLAHEINTPAQYLLDNAGFLQEACGDLLALFDEFKNLLPSVKTNQVLPDQISHIEQCLLKANVDFLAKEIPAAINQSRTGIEHIAKIVQAMKEFSQPSTLEKIPTDLNHALETTLTVSRHEWTEVAETKCNFQSNLPLVPCLPGELNQVFLNLIVNAAHAIADKVKGASVKGLITVSTEVRTDVVQIRISDTGTGIPENIRTRVFDPFVTTKEVGKGTGQGLAIARSIIVDKHGGTIHFETEAGSGTTFILCLPLAPAPAPASRAVGPAAPK